MQEAVQEVQVKLTQLDILVVLAEVEQGDLIVDQGITLLPILVLVVEVQVEHHLHQMQKQEEVVMALLVL